MSSEAGDRQQSPGARFPAVMPVMVQLLRNDGTPLEAEVRSGRTRDVSETGMGLELGALPAGLAATLEGERELCAEVDVRAGRHTLRVAGKLTWVRVIARGELRTGVLGLEYAGVAPEVVARIVHQAKHRTGRATAWRVTAGLLALALVVGGLAYWRVSALQRAAIAEVEARLTQAVQLKQQRAAELDKASEQIKTLEAQVGTRDEVLTEKQAEIDELRQELGEMQEAVGELSVRLANLKVRPPAGIEQNAVYHLERAKAFSARYNEAAALIELERAAALDPSLAEAHLGIAEVSALYGRKAQAVQSYKRYLELEPHALDGPEIREYLRELEAQAGK